MPDVVGGGGETRPDMRGVLPAGTTLRGYELKSILGQGAFGITYRARDTTLDRDVAIKEYLPTALALREGRTTVVPRSADHAEQFAWGRERFLDEARTLARLDRTPAIVRVHDYLEDNGTAYMVMALIEGETLNKRLMREQRLAPEAIERLVFPLLDGLEEVHGAGFLHRDIKPANIMVDTHGRPTLIDFGASRAAMAERSTTMTAIFTPGYAAAEQFSASNPGPWSDIYGLAATLYHAITGQIPPSAVQRILNDTYQPLGELQPPGYPAALLAGIDAGLAVRVEDRPQSIAEWRHMLRSEEWLSSHEATRVTHKPGRLARAASRSRQTRVTIRGPALGAAAAAAMLLLAGAGYLAYQANAPGTASTAVLSLSAEQLEQALVERRKADALAAEKRRLEDEARKKAEAEAEAKRQAEAELEQARQARQKAEDELATLKADIESRRRADPDQRDQADAAKQRVAEEEARRKAEAEAAALRQAEEEAGKRAAADAEAKRQADEALARAEAERQRAEADARAKAETETAARRQASEEDQRKAAEAESVKQAEQERAKAEAERQKAEAERQKAETEARARMEAETAEKALRLDQQGRESVQLALSSLGFDTRGTDGIFGPRSRDMISAWQKTRNQPATGFLNAAQQQALLKEAAPALTKHDEQKKAEEEAKARLAAAATPPTAAAGALERPRTTEVTPSAAQPSGTAYDGTYSAIIQPSGTGNTVQYGEACDKCARLTVGLRVSNGRGSGTIDAPGCSTSLYSVAISPTGQISGEGYFNCAIAVQTTSIGAGPLKIEGTYKGGKPDLFFSTGRSSFNALLNRGPAASSSLPSPDGLWRGTYACTAVSGGGLLPSFTLDLNLKLVNGISSGGGFLESAATGRTLNIEVLVNPPNVTVTRTYMFGSGNSPVNRSSMQGQFDGTSIRASGRQYSGVNNNQAYDCTLTLTRA